MKGKWWGDVPGHFMPYFLVRDCDAAAARAAELGGGATVPPMDIPHVGRFAVLHDDQWAHFSVIAILPMPATDDLNGRTRDGARAVPLRRVSARRCYRPPRRRSRCARST